MQDLFEKTSNVMAIVKVQLEKKYHNNALDLGCLNRESCQAII